VEPEVELRELPVAEEAASQESLHSHASHVYEEIKDANIKKSKF
jgi:hypothetical protein